MSKNENIILLCILAGAFLFPQLVIAVEALFVPRYVIAGLLSGAASGIAMGATNAVFGAICGFLTPVSFVARRTDLKWAGWACVIWSVLVLVFLVNAYSNAPSGGSLYLKAGWVTDYANWRQKDLYIQMLPHLLWAVFLLYRGVRLLKMNEKNKGLE